MAEVIDCHLHIVGNGSTGSGCELTLRKHFGFFAKILLRSFGLPQSALRGDLDTLYLDTIRKIIDGSRVAKVVILANDRVFNANGTPITDCGSIYIPNSYILKLARENEKFLAGVSIHPARPDALEELARCVEGGAVLMKCLPNCHNIDCLDDRYVPFWEAMAKAKLPLLAHTGGEMSMPVYDDVLADPSRLRVPLECGVTVIGAHCGTSSMFFDRDYTEVFRAMLERYPNLYGDNSGMMTPVRVRHMRKLLSPEFQKRMVYGSDMPIPISARWAYYWGLISRRDYLECNAELNLLNRDLKLKEKLGFAPETFSRFSAEILNR